MKVPALPQWLLDRGIRLVALDFETYYDDKYTLKKLTYEEYIRNNKFEPLCLSAFDGSQTYIAWGSERISALLKELKLDDKNTITVAHNARFDGAIAEWVFGIQINLLACSQVLMRITGLSRLAGEKLEYLVKVMRKNGWDLPSKGDQATKAIGLHVGDMSPEFIKEYESYCIDDSVSCWGAAAVMLQYVTWQQLIEVDMIFRMFTRPVFILDKELLAQYIDKLVQDRITKLEALGANFGMTYSEFESAIRSSSKFAKLLLQCDADPPKKVSVRKTQTAKALDESSDVIYTYAFAKDDVEFLALKHHPNPLVSKLVDARIEFNSSLALSRAKSFYDLACRGRMPAPIEPYAAHTGRGGGADKINVQNLPKRTGDKSLRRAITIDPGYEIASCDSSQVEARLLAYSAGQEDLIELFRSGGDPYCHMASIIYNQSYDVLRYYYKAKVESLTSDLDRKRKAACHRMRGIGKQTILGSGYGMSGPAFALWLAGFNIILDPPSDVITEWEDTYGKQYTNKREHAMAERAFREEYHVLECCRINSVYRKAVPAIVRYWRGCDQALKSLLVGGSGSIGGPNGDLVCWDGNHTVFGARVPGILLPSGYWLLYPDLRTEVTNILNQKTGCEEPRVITKYTIMKKGKAENNTIHGAKLVENITQAIAFDAMKWQISKVSPCIPIRMNEHDAWVVVYKTEAREQVKQLMESAMKTAPDYLPGMMFGCEFAHANRYGDIE